MMSIHGRFYFTLPLVLVLLFPIAVDVGPIIGCETRMRSANALLDSPLTRSLMSALFETKLLMLTMHDPCPYIAVPGANP